MSAFADRERRMAMYMDSRQAAAALGVRRQTLYAYVSRGLLQSLPGNDRRGSRFRSADVARLAAQRSRGRKPRQVAKAALDWGLPVMESALTLIEDGKLYYRGRPVTELANSASLEDIARLLWNCGSDDPFSSPASLPSPEWRNALRAMKGKPLPQQCVQLFASGYPEVDTHGWQHGSGRTMRACASLLRLLAAAVLGVEPDAEPIHLLCRRAWRLNREEAETVRAALVVCADHELNASSFTARCIASTGAGMGAVILGGLSALSGPLHGGYTERVEALFDALRAGGAFEDVLKERLAGGDIIPGFGHPLYPDGDPRAHAILMHLPRNETLDRIIGTVEILAGVKPNIDFALVALRRSLRLPSGSAYGIFAIARAAGWIAHALEQRAQKSLIRPRATYVGPRPGGGHENREAAGRIIRLASR